MMRAHASSNTRHAHCAHIVQTVIAMHQQMTDDCQHNTHVQAEQRRYSSAAAAPATHRYNRTTWFLV
jgi:hypothetical protein